MPLKKDDDGRRWVELEFLVPGTPEQVWQAIATGPGMSAWFTPTTVDECVGGAIEFDFGEGGYEAPSGAPALVGVMERIHQDGRTSDVMVRLTEPMPGVAAVGACEVGGQTMLMVSIYFYGAAAGDTAAAELPKWQAWMAQLEDADSAAS